jgi:hypothetical protein
MNKVVNIFSGVVLAAFSLMVMAVVYDLSLASGMSLRGLPYKVEIFTSFAVLVLILGAIRIRRKWQGANDMKKFKRFAFERKLSRSSLNLSVVHTVLESIFMGVIIYFFSRIAELSPEFVYPMIAVIAILLLESLVFLMTLIKGGKAFKLGIDKKVVAYYNREMHLFYFTGLKRIELYQNMVNFQYRDDLNLLMPLDILNNEDRVAFRDALIELLEGINADKREKFIYIDDAFRNLS